MNGITIPQAVLRHLDSGILKNEINDKYYFAKTDVKIKCNHLFRLRYIKFVLFFLTGIDINQAAKF